MSTLDLVKQTSSPTPKMFQLKGSSRKSSIFNSNESPLKTKTKPSWSLPLLQKFRALEEGLNTIQHSCFLQPSHRPPKVLLIPSEELQELCPIFSRSSWEKHSTYWELPSFCPYWHQRHSALNRTTSKQSLPLRAKWFDGRDLWWTSAGSCCDAIRPPLLDSLSGARPFPFSSINHAFIRPRCLRKLCWNFSWKAEMILEFDSNNQNSQRGESNDPSAYFTCSVSDGPLEVMTRNPVIRSYWISYHSLYGQNPQLILAEPTDTYYYDPNKLLLRINTL